MLITLATIAVLSAIVNSGFSDVGLSAGGLDKDQSTAKQFLSVKNIPRLLSITLTLNFLPTDKNGVKEYVAPLSVENHSEVAAWSAAEVEPSVITFEVKVKTLSDLVHIPSNNGKTNI